MKQCYVIYFNDGDIDCVTTEDIDKYGNERGFNVFHGARDRGYFVRKDGHSPCRHFVGALLK